MLMLPLVITSMGRVVDAQGVLTLLLLSFVAADYWLQLQCSLLCMKTSRE